LIKFDRNLGRSPPVSFGCKDQPHILSSFILNLLPARWQHRCVCHSVCALGISFLLALIETPASHSDSERTAGIPAARGRQTVGRTNGRLAESGGRPADGGPENSMPARPDSNLNLNPLRSRPGGPRPGPPVLHWQQPSSFRRNLQPRRRPTVTDCPSQTPDRVGQTDGSGGPGGPRMVTDQQTVGPARRSTLGRPDSNLNARVAPTARRVD
jgi:hypothetical protein